MTGFQSNYQSEMEEAVKDELMQYSETSAFMNKVNENFNEMFKDSIKMEIRSSINDTEIRDILFTLVDEAEDSLHEGLDFDIASIVQDILD